MSDAGAVALAIATGLGALAARPVPLVAGALVGVLALVLRSSLVAVTAAALVASALAANAWSGVRPPTLGAVPARTPATLVTDPEPTDFGALRAVARVGGKHVELWARGAAAAGLRSRLAGERILVGGSIARPPPAARDRLAVRHVGSRMTVTDVVAVDGGLPHARVANALRRLLLGGAGSLPPPRRALFAGVVLGDDREQDAATVEDFRGSGLSHLLAVSGQNVAFALALVAPLLRRLGLRGRFAVAVIVLVLFGTMTRWEPSVLRAVAMTGLGVFAMTVGRPATATRLLSLAVVAALLVDPLLVRSIGFLLSVGASSGIVLLAPLLRRRLPEPLAVTVAAQVGVAPVLLPVFGSTPFVAPLANLLAVPAAGPLMTWGVVAGLPAGAVVELAGGTGLGERVAAALHLPTQLLVGWIAYVARTAAAVPAGHVTPSAATTAAGAAAVVAVVVVGAVSVDAARHRLRSRRRVVARSPLPPPAPPSRRRAAARPAVAAGVTAFVVALVALVVVPAALPPPSAAAALATGGGSDRLWRRGAATVVVTDGRAPPGRLLGALRRAGVGRVTLLVVAFGGRRTGRALEPLLARLPVDLAVVPAERAFGTDPAPAVHARRGMRVRAGAWEVTVVDAGPPVEVQVRSVHAPRARPP